MHKDCFQMYVKIKINITLMIPNTEIESLRKPEPKNSFRQSNLSQNDIYNLQEHNTDGHLLKNSHVKTIPTKQ